MKNLIQTTAVLAILTASSAYAGTAMVSPGKGGPPPMQAAGCSPEISYNSIEAAWSHTFIKQSGFDDANGIGIKLEYSPLNQLYFVGEGDWNTTSFQGTDIDGWGALAGIGGYVALAQGLHFATDLGGIWEGAKADGDKVSDGGFYVRPHLRFRAACAEVHIGAKFVSMNDFGDRWEIFGDLYYEVARNLDLTVGAATVLEGDNDWALRAGVRYRF